MTKKTVNGKVYSITAAGYERINGKRISNLICTILQHPCLKANITDEEKDIFIELERKHNDKTYKMC